MKALQAPTVPMDPAHSPSVAHIQLWPAAQELPDGISPDKRINLHSSICHSLKHYSLRDDGVLSPDDLQV